MSYPVLVEPGEWSGKVVALSVINRFKIPEAVDKVSLTLEGLAFDRYQSQSRLATVRDEAFSEKGDLLLNDRQVSIVATQELKRIASKLGVSNIVSEDLNANIEIGGLESLTSLPIGTKIIFPQKAILMITGENPPCVFPGKKIAGSYGKPELASKFVKAAMGLRGITAMSYRPGWIRLGDDVKIQTPKILKYA